MKVTIIGGGFGLYGYLPALFQLPNINIILPKRYQERIKGRDDIKQFYNFIVWTDNLEKSLAACEGVIIALPPKQQYIIAKKCIDIKNINHILLEKPLACSPELAIDLLNSLELSGKKFRIGYNFRYTYWGKKFLHEKKGVENIYWRFSAHHYAQNIETWKRYHNEGGGALRFYGIHLIALLAELGYKDLSYSKISTKQENEVEIWEAELLGADLFSCRIYVDSNSDYITFNVQENNQETYLLKQPFEIKQSHITLIDRRVPFIKEALEDLFYEDQLYYEWYKATNLLWDNIEKKSKKL